MPTRQAQAPPQSFPSTHTTTAESVRIDAYDEGSRLASAQASLDGGPPVYVRLGAGACPAKIPIRIAHGHSMRHGHSKKKRGLGR